MRARRRSSQAQAEPIIVQTLHRGIDRTTAGAAAAERRTLSRARGRRLVQASAVLLVAVSVSSHAADASQEPTVTPYRPSVSTPAALSAPGWLELEIGGQHLHDGSSARRDSMPYTLKLAFSEDWGIRLGGDGWVRQRDESGRVVSGGGDTVVVLKRRFGIDATSAFGIEGGASIPTARATLGSGKSDYSVNGIYSADFGRYHTDLNLVATRVGMVEPGISRTQLLWAGSLSTALNDRWGLVGELSGTRQRGTDHTAQALAALSYNVSSSLTLDAGLSRSLRSGAPTWSAFAGLTVLVGRIF